MAWMEPFSATASISFLLWLPVATRAASKWGFTSTSRSPSMTLREKHSANNGSMPDEHPAMMDRVPVGAMVVTVALR